MEPITAVLNHFGYSTKVLSHSALHPKSSSNWTRKKLLRKFQRRSDTKGWSCDPMIWPAGSSVLLGQYHQKNVKDSQERAWVYKKDSASPVMNMCFDIIHWTLDAKRVIEKKQGWKGTTQSFAGLRRSQWVLSDYKFNNLSIGLVYWHHTLDCVKKSKADKKEKATTQSP